MSNYSNNECTQDEGLDYIFGRMSAIYGAAFLRHWEGVDLELVRQEWQRQLGRFLTYRPSMDYAIDRLKGEFPPSAITFREYCNAGPNIPTNQAKLEYKPTPVDSEVVAEARRKLKEMRAKWTN
jgi:hypothetical protein